MHRAPALALALLLAANACSGSAVRRPSTDPPSDTDPPGGDDTAEPCLLGERCNPIVVDAFPTSAHDDTTVAHESDVDFYACAPDTDESGPDVWFEVHVPTAGVLSVTVTDGADVDIDVQLLEGLDAHDCLARAHEELGWYVDAGVYYLVADTFVDGAGEPQAGPFDLDIDLVPLDDGPCALLREDLRMFWSDCASGIDCYRADDDGVERSWLRTPAFGPVVLEAHLVTTADVAHLDGGWPGSFWDGIPDHYARSEGITGYAAERDQPWAPDGEGNAHFGQGATGQPLPPEDEGWYVNMYWRDRPAPGTRMLLVNPFNARAVVTSAGYETGPGSNEAIGGATEEVHDWLGTGHRDPLVMGFLVDQDLPLGPIDCGD